MLKILPNGGKFFRFPTPSSYSPSTNFYVGMHVFSRQTWYTPSPMIKLSKTIYNILHYLYCVAWQQVIFKTSSFTSPAFSWIFGFREVHRAHSAHFDSTPWSSFFLWQFLLLLIHLSKVWTRPSWYHPTQYSSFRKSTTNKFTITYFVCMCMGILIQK